MEMNDHTQSQQICIGILSMGRSGTSLLSGSLQCLGVHIGSNLVPPNGMNPKGFFEDEKVVELNSLVLRKIRSYHGDFGALNCVDWQRADMGACAAEIAEFVRLEFGGSKVFALKDPRLCRVWPIWNSVLNQLKIVPYFLNILRSPLEVVQSLHQLGVSTNAALLWWIAYTLDSNEYSIAERRCVIHYSELSKNPVDVLVKIGSAFRLRWPRSIEDAREDLELLNDSTLYHFRNEPDGLRQSADRTLLRTAERLYDAFAGSEINQKDITLIRSEFSILRREYYGWRHPFTGFGETPPSGPS